MNESIHWSEAVPSLAENRVRYMAVLIACTIIMLGIVAIPYDAVAPSQNFFTSNSDSELTLDSGVSEVSLDTDSLVHNKVPFDDGGIAIRPTINQTSTKDSSVVQVLTDPNLSAAPFISTNPLGTGDSRFSDDSDNLSVVTFDKLLASTGFTKINKTEKPSEQIVLPARLSDLLKVIGDLEDNKKLHSLLKIAGSQDFAVKARAMAISALTKFADNDLVSDLLYKILESKKEPYSLKEISINTLVDIDGVTFEKFFVNSCFSMVNSKVKDIRMCELLTLAAFRDVSLYNGRSVKKVVPQIRQYVSRSEFINSICSTQLRLKGYRATATELENYYDSQNLSVLSSFVYYIGKNAEKDPLSRTLLLKIAKTSLNPSIRRLVNKALESM